MMASLSADTLQQFYDVQSSLVPKLSQALQFMCCNYLLHSPQVILELLRVISQNRFRLLHKQLLLYRLIFECLKLHTFQIEFQLACQDIVDWSILSTLGFDIMDQLRDFVLVILGKFEVNFPEISPEAFRGILEILYQGLRALFSETSSSPEFGTSLSQHQPDPVHHASHHLHSSFHLGSDVEENLGSQLGSILEIRSLQFGVDVQPGGGLSVGNLALDEFSSGTEHQSQRSAHLYCR